MNYLEKVANIINKLQQMFEHHLHAAMCSDCVHQTEVQPAALYFSSDDITGSLIPNHLSLFIYMVDANLLLE